MPNKHAAIKDLRKNHRRAARNLRMKTHAKYLVREITALIKEGNKGEAQAMAKLLQQTVAKAAKTHVLHVNKAARQVASAHKAISRLK